MHVFEELVLYPETTIYEVQINKKFTFSRYQKTLFFILSVKIAFCMIIIEIT